MQPPGEVIDALTGAGRLVVAGHVSPDLDAAGAMLGLARAVPVSDAAVVLPAATPNARLQFMLELAGDVPTADADRVERADVIAVVDTAGTNRVNLGVDWERVAGKSIVNIDHHITNTDFGTVNWVVDHAGSTCELVYRLITAAGWPLDGTTASLLYAGIYSDTGGFSLPNATAETFDAAAALVRAGADLARVGSRLWRSQQPHEFELIRVVYHNTRLAGDGRIAYSTLSHAEITTAGCSPDDIDDQVSIPRSLSGIRMAMLFSEGVPGVIRINLRGEEGTAVLELARKLGGGGHTFSAGVRIRGTMEAAVRRVLDEAEAYLK